MRKINVIPNDFAFTNAESEKIYDIADWVSRIVGKGDDRVIFLYAVARKMKLLIKPNAS
jgi:hypothetical protein